MGFDFLSGFGDKCAGCGQKMHNGDPCIFDADYPSPMSNFHRLIGDYKVYHKNCYLKKIDKTT